MNSRFEKYLKMLYNNSIDEAQKQKTLDELHKSFASLSQEEQKYANIFLHDVQSGNTIIESGKTFRDYITEYQFSAKNNQIHQMAQLLGLDEVKLRKMMNENVTDKNINEYGRFDSLLQSVDKSRAKEYFEKRDNEDIPLFKVNIKVHDLLQRFITSGGFEI